MIPLMAWLPIAIGDKSVGRTAVGDPHFSPLFFSVVIPPVARPVTIFHSIQHKYPSHDVTEWIRANVMSVVTVHGFTVQGSKVDFSENLLVKVAHLIKFKGGQIRRACSQYSIL